MGATGIDFCGKAHVKAEVFAHQKSGNFEYVISERSLIKKSDFFACEASKQNKREASTELTFQLTFLLRLKMPKKRRKNAKMCFSQK